MLHIKQISCLLFPIVKRFHLFSTWLYFNLFKIEKDTKSLTSEKVLRTNFGNVADRFCSLVRHFAVPRCACAKLGCAIYECGVGSKCSFSMASWIFGITKLSKKCLLVSPILHLNESHLGEAWCHLKFPHESLLIQDRHGPLHGCSDLASQSSVLGRGDHWDLESTVSFFRFANIPCICVYESIKCNFLNRL